MSLKSAVLQRRMGKKLQCLDMQSCNQPQIAAKGGSLLEEGEPAQLIICIHHFDSLALLNLP